MTVWVSEFLKPDTIYIYTLSDKTGIRYIGQTNNPNIRLSSHKCNGGRGRDKTKRGQWIKSLMDNGEAPILTVVEECSRKVSNERERYWVNFYWQRGEKLLNGAYKLKPYAAPGTV